MKVCLIHNDYGSPSGEETIIEGVQNLLESNGHEVVKFFRSSNEITEKHFGSAQAFFSGIYNPFSIRAFRQLLTEQRPDIVHIQNLFPFISPSILPECRKAGIPVVMAVQNYRLICPTGLHLLNGKVCEKCCRGHEYWCLLRNCEGSYAKSLGYFLRNYLARKMRYYLDNVTIFAVVTKFQQKRLTEEGFPSERIAVNPNMAIIDELHSYETMVGTGGFVAHVGRISLEKGIPTLLEAALLCPDTNFKSTGKLNRMPELVDQTPPNFEFVGYLDDSSLRGFYVSARFMVVSTICFEGLPMTIIEAMLHGKAIICSRIGGLPEIVEDGKTGLLFEPGNAVDLAEKVQYLWGRPELCMKMGRAGREKALREYSPSRHYERLMNIYAHAKDIASRSSGHLDG